MNAPAFTTIDNSSVDYSSTNDKESMHILVGVKADDYEVKTIGQDLETIC